MIAGERQGSGKEGCGGRTGKLGDDGRSAAIYPDIASLQLTMVAGGGSNGCSGSDGNSDGSSGSNGPVMSDAHLTSYPRRSTPLVAHHQLDQLYANVNSTRQHLSYPFCVHVCVWKHTHAETSLGTSQ